MSRSLKATSPLIVVVALLLTSTLLPKSVEARALHGPGTFNRFSYRPRHPAPIEREDSSEESSSEEDFEDSFESFSDEDDSTEDDEVTFFKPYQTSELIRLLRLLDQLQSGRKEAWNQVSPADIHKITRLLDKFGKRN